MTAGRNGAREALENVKLDVGHAASLGMPIDAACLAPRA
jgi:hypothetical protein